MKFFVAAKWDEEIGYVSEIYGKIRDRGHDISEDWTQHECVKPYDKDVPLSRENSKRNLQGILDCDVLIYLSDKPGTGKDIDLGAAIISHRILKKPLIYAVGENVNESQYYLDLSVKRIKTKYPPGVIDAIIDETEGVLL